MGARKRVGTGLSYRPARLQRLAELIPWKTWERVPDCDTALSVLSVDVQLSGWGGGGGGGGGLR